MFYAAGHRRVFCCCGQQENSQPRQGLHVVGLAVKETIRCKSTYSKQLVDERLTATSYNRRDERFIVVQQLRGSYFLSYDSVRTS